MLLYPNQIKSTPILDDELEDYPWASTTSTSTDAIVAIFDNLDIDLLKLPSSPPSARVQISFIPRPSGNLNGPLFTVQAQLVGSTGYINAYYPCPDECQKYDKDFIFAATSGPFVTRTVLFDASHVKIARSYQGASCVGFRFKHDRSEIGMFPVLIHASTKIIQYTKASNYVFRS